MNKQNVVSTRVSDDVLALIDRIAVARDRSRAWVLATLVERAARDEIAFHDFVEQGQAGPWLSHEELLADLAMRKQSRQAA